MIVTNAAVVAANLSARASASGARAAAIVRHHGQLLTTRVKSHASGRPGPNVITGDYRRSINMQMDFSEGVAAIVGTNAPQGPRLEYGFNDIDALGRSYNQPPYPHFEPAISETQDEFYEAIGGMA